MSMNIYFFASREIQILKTGKIEKQTITFRAYQTPTAVTKQILTSSDPIQTYCNWVIEKCSHDEVVNVYADDDIFEERSPIGTTIVNDGKDHVESFMLWVTDVTANGYEIFWCEQ